MENLLLFIIAGLFSQTVGQVLYCPGQTSIECSSQPTPGIVWDGTALNEECPPDDGFSLVGITADNITDMFVCGQFTVTVTNVEMTVDGGITTTTVLTTLSFNATSSLNGERVACRTAGSGNTVDIQFEVPDLPIPTLSITQVNLTAVMIDMNVVDDRCAQYYVAELTSISGSDCPSATANGSTSSLLVSGLGLCRCQYRAVGYVQAPTGMEGGKNSLVVQVDLSGLNGITIQSSGQVSMLQWDQQTNANDLADCITGYKLSWTDQELLVNTSTTSVTAEQLNDAGFPYCQAISVTVTPETAVGPVTNRSEDGNVVLRPPGFSEPQIAVSSVVREDGMFNMTISWQAVSDVSVPIRLYGLIAVGQGICMANMSPTGESVTVTVSRGEYTVCVTFQNNSCMATSSTNHTALWMLLTNPQTPMPSPGDTFFTVTVDLPSLDDLGTDPTTLSIYSSVTPGDIDPILEDYPSSQQQYTVTFRGLRSGVEYTYDIRVVLRSDLNTVVSMSVMGSFTLPAPLPPCGTDCIIGVCVGVVLLLLITVAICLVIVVVCKKLKDAAISKDTEKLTRGSSPPDGPGLYADPSTIERETVPGTTDQYAIVDAKTKEKKAAKPTQPEALYQDPNKIEHEAAPGGEMYAVVDKPRGSSKKKKEPDVVPPGTEGLTYADIDVTASRSRPKQASQRQAQEPVGSVEYSDVKFKEDGSTL